MGQGMKEGRHATERVNLSQLKGRRKIPNLMMGKGPPGQPHASSNTNTSITVYGFLGSLANPGAPGGD